MPLTLPPPAPSTGDPATFASRADAHLAWQATNVDEMNAFQANLNSVAAGGAYALGYIFSSATADVDPTSGKLALNNATQNAATTLRLDLTVGGQDYTSVIDTFDDSTSAVKGTIRLVKMGDLTKWLMFNVTALASPTGYRNITVTNTGGSSASPFANGDGVLLYFQRTGDIGPTGPTPSIAAQTLYVRDERPQGTGGGVLGTSGNTRILNTVKINTITDASLASNSATLPAGTYEYEGSAPYAASVNSCGHKVQLYNNTDAVVIDNGTSEWTSDATSGAAFSNRSYVRGIFTIAAPKVVLLRHFYTSGGGTDGAGRATNLGGSEVYAELIFRKVA